MNERRLARLQNQIQQRLAEVLQREIADPKLGLVTITRVELDREFTQCKAYWSVIATKGKEEWARNQSAGVLDRARGFCQREMAKVLHTRTIPHLEFHFDEGIAGAVRMQKLLHELNAGKAAAEQPGEAGTDVDADGGGEASPDDPPAPRPDPTDGPAGS